MRIEAERAPPAGGALAAAGWPRGGADLRVSFEFFPPKDWNQEGPFWHTVVRLAPMRPAFMSVTCGAGGSTRERTLSCVRGLLRLGFPGAAHLTCAGAARGDIDAIARAYWNDGIRHIVALRGDPVDAGPGGRYVPRPDGYAYADALVAGLKRIADFEISVAGYPERHPESVSVAAEIDSLKRKVDAGAARIITQFCFQNDVIEDYAERVRAAGIGVPVVPGLLPIGSLEQVARFASRTNVCVPDWLRARFSRADGSHAARSVAARVLLEQALDLRQRGFRDLHFYTMNRADPTAGACRALAEAAMPAAAAPRRA